MKRECQKGWLSTYIEYTKPQESPTVFHTWTAISTIASALRRQVWMNRGYYILYPNLFIILVSPSGVGNKTTCMKIGTEDILAKALPDLDIMRGSLTIPFLADKLVQIEAKHPLKESPITVFCEEFKVFSKGLYADSGLIENLTKLFDNGMFEYLPKKNQIIIQKPCVNMLAGSTPEWLTTGSASDFIGGGFSSRILPVAITKREKRIAWPEKPSTSKDLEQKLIKDLAQIGGLKGEFFVTKEAKDYFTQWYEVLMDKNRNPDRRLDGFYSKKADMVLKVSMSIAVSVGDDLVIIKDHIETALKLITKLEDNIPFAYQGVAWNEKVKMQDQVLIVIKEAGKIFYADLMEAFHFKMTGNDLKGCVMTLCDEEKVKLEKIPSQPTGRPKVACIYIGEKKETK